MHAVQRVRDSRPIKAVGVTLTTLAVVLGVPSLAYAQVTPTETETAITSGFGELTGLIVGVLAVALFGITVAALGIRMGVKWLRRGASS